MSDKLNHASIVDGCLTSGAEFRRFKHNDMADLEHRLQQIPDDAARLVIVDAVFSMDGDVIDLPRLAELCRQLAIPEHEVVRNAHERGIVVRDSSLPIAAIARQHRLSPEQVYQALRGVPENRAHP